MPKTTEIELGDQKITVPALNLEQLETVMDAFNANAPAKVPGIVIRTALSRCEGVDVSKLEPTLPQLADATQKILELAGLKKPENPPAPSAEAPKAST